MLSSQSYDLPYKSFPAGIRGPGDGAGSSYQTLPTGGTRLLDSRLPAVPTLPNPRTWALQGLCRGFQLTSEPGRGREQDRDSHPPSWDSRFTRAGVGDQRGVFFPGPTCPTSPNINHVFKMSKRRGAAPVRLMIFGVSLTLPITYNSLDRPWGSGAETVGQQGGQPVMNSLDAPWGRGAGPQDTGPGGLHGAAAAPRSRGPGERRPGERRLRSREKSPREARSRGAHRVHDPLVGAKSKGSSLGKTRKLKRPHHGRGE